MKKEFRTFTKKENRDIRETNPKLTSSTSHSKTHSVSNPEYERLTFGQMQSITRSMLKDPKKHLQNMGIISSIKGKMYCLQLGQVSTSKDFTHYFYTNQYRRKQQLEPLKQMSENSLYCTNTQKFD